MSNYERAQEGMRIRKYISSMLVHSANAAELVTECLILRLSVRSMWNMACIGQTGRRKRMLACMHVQAVDTAVEQRDRQPICSCKPVGQSVRGRCVLVMNSNQRRWLALLARLCSLAFAACPPCFTALFATLSRRPVLPPCPAAVVSLIQDVEHSPSNDHLLALALAALASCQQICHSLLERHVHRALILIL